MKCHFFQRMYKGNGKLSVKNKRMNRGWDNDLVHKGLLSKYEDLSSNPLAST